jgi:hypothetical protein
MIKRFLLAKAILPAFSVGKVNQFSANLRVDPGRRGHKSCRPALSTVLRSGPRPHSLGRGKGPGTRTVVDHRKPELSGPTLRFGHPPACNV